MPAKKTAKKSTRKKTTKKKTAKKSTKKTTKAAKKTKTKKARESLDTVADRFEKDLEELEGKAKAAKVHAKYKMMDAKDAVEKGVERTEDWIKKNPLKAIGGALALGWLVGKSRRKKKK